MIFPQRRWVVFVWFRFLSVAAPLRDVGFGGGLIVPQRRWEQGPSRNDAEDTSRSLGFSPGTKFSSPLKSPVFFEGWGRAGMLGLHFWPSCQECSGYLFASASELDALDTPIALPTALRPRRLILTRPSPPREQTRPRHSNSRLGGGLYVTDIAGNPRAVPESHNSSESASAGPQTTALCHTVLSLWPARHCPNNTPKADS